MPMELACLFTQKDLMFARAAGANEFEGEY